MLLGQEQGRRGKGEEEGLGLGFLWMLRHENPDFRYPEIGVSISGFMEGVTKLPPGFRFHPTEEDLVCCYLRNKVAASKPSSSQSLLQLIREVNVFGFDPVDLPEKAGLAVGDGQWFFFTERKWKHANGERRNRATETGVWRIVGRDSPVVSKRDGIVGMKRTLVFYRGKPGSYTETDWMMNEYVLVDRGNRFMANKDPFAICCVFLRPNVNSQRLESDGRSCVESDHVGTSMYCYGNASNEQTDETTLSSAGEITIEVEAVSEDDELQKILIAMLDAEDDSSVMQSSYASFHQEMLAFDWRDQSCGILDHAGDEMPQAILEGDFIELNDLIPAHPKVH